MATANESMLKFRLGVFVLGTLLLLAMLIVLFGEIPDFFRSQIHYSLKLPQAPGIVEGTPVRKSGIRIGEVASVALDSETGEVTLALLIEKRYQLRKSDDVSLTRGLVLGETAINFVPNLEARGEPAPDGFVFQGQVPDDIAKALTEARDLLPLGREAIEDFRALAKKVNEIIPEVRKTNAELQVTLNNMGRAAETVDNLLRTNEDRITVALDNVAKVAGELGNLFTPENQRKLTRLIDNAASLSDRLPAFFSEDNRENLQASLKNAKQASEQVNQLLSDENRKAAEKALQSLADAGDRLGKVLSDENQKNLSDTLANARKSSEQVEKLIDNLNATSVDARTTMKTISEQVDRVGAQVEAGVKETREVVGRLGKSADSFDEAMNNVRDVAKMVNERGPVILKNIEDASARVSQLTSDVGELTRLLTSSDGTIRRLISDPSLFNNLNDTARAVNLAAARFDRIVKDISVFADKIARHPELLGVRGTVAPSSGIK